MFGPDTATVLSGTSGNHPSRRKISNCVSSLCSNFCRSALQRSATYDDTSGKVHQKKQVGERFLWHAKLISFILDIKGEFTTHVSNSIASDIVKGSDASQARTFILCESGHDRHRPRVAAIVRVARSPSGSRASTNFRWPNQEDHP